MIAPIETMDLSIIIVNWNMAGMLCDCLASVFSRLGKLKAEVIVVDNGSTDNSVQMVEQNFPETILIRNSENRGFAAANNQALQIARGDFVLLLNSDTVLHGDVLERCVNYMVANPRVGILGCRVMNTDGTLQPDLHSISHFAEFDAFDERSGEIQLASFPRSI